MIKSNSAAFAVISTSSRFILNRMYVNMGTLHMLQNLFEVSRIFLVVTFLLSLYSVSDRTNLSPQGKEKNSLYSAEEFRELLKFVYVICIVLGYLYFRSPLATFILSIVTIAVIALRIGLEKRGLIKSCNCYGVISNKGNFAKYADALVLLTSTYIATYSFARFSFESSYLLSATNWLAIPPLLVLAMLFSTRLTSVLENKSLPPNVAPEKSEVAPLVLPSDSDLIGKSIDSEEIKFSQILKPDKPIMIVGLTKDCPACDSLKPAIFPLAEIFDDSIHSVFAFISDAGGSDVDLDKSSTVFNTDELAIKLNVTSFPYAVLIDSNTRKAVSPIVYGPRNIWSMYYLGLSAIKNN